LKSANRLIKQYIFWEVSTTTGSASGYAMSEAQALKQSN
jgi:hypothetical protein